jgi:hypothetical protein
MEDNNSSNNNNSNNNSNDNKSVYLLIMDLPDSTLRHQTHFFLFGLQKYKSGLKNPSPYTTGTGTVVSVFK